MLRRDSICRRFVTAYAQTKLTFSFNGGTLGFDAGPLINNGVLCVDNRKMVIERHIYIGRVRRHKHTFNVFASIRGHR